VYVCSVTVRWACGVGRSPEAREYSGVKPYSYGAIALTSRDVSGDDSFKPFEHSLAVLLSFAALPVVLPLGAMLPIKVIRNFDPPASHRALREFYFCVVGVYSTL
jgi:hypothetical protein